MIEVIILGFIFVFGTIVGSFLNVLILRHNTGLGLIRRSHCFSCDRKLSWHELFPIVSFLIQRGRCRNCGSRISSQYPLVEFLTGILFVLIFLKLGFSFSGYWLLAIGYWLIFSLLLAIAIYDVRHKIIPNEFVSVFAVFALLSIFLIPHSKFLIQDLLAGPLLAAPLAFLWLVSEGRWMGLGDGKLMVGIGWLLGLQKGIAALFLSFWIGGLVGIILILLNSLKRLPLQGKGLTIKSEIPFAPFLILGAFLAFFFDISFSDIESFFTFSFLTL